MYFIELAAKADGYATFTVTRDQPGTDRDPVVWVHVDDGDPSPAQQDDAPVIWGSNASLTGTATLPVSGSGRAYATETPWRVRKSDPSVEF